MDTTVIISSGEAIDDAITNLVSLKEEINAINVVDNKYYGERGNAAKQMDLGDGKISLLKGSMKVLVNDTITFLSKLKEEFENIDEVATEDINELDGDK